MEWKDINGFEGKYQISEDVRVRSIGRVVKNKCGTMTVNERILTPWIHTCGYKHVCLCNDGKCQSKKVHRLIAEAFVPPYSGEQVNHIDGDKLNNSIENLEWCTGSENMLHAYHNGLHSGATPVILVELGIQFPTIEEAARFVNGKHSGIRRCLTGRNKTHRGFHFVRAEEDDHD